MTLVACPGQAEPRAGPEPAPSPEPVTAAEPPPPEHRPSDYTACLQPLGDHDPALLAIAERGIAQLYGFTTATLEARPLPDSAWYPPRSRYRADRLLDHLTHVIIPGSGCNFIVGFTSVDISTTTDTHEDWGVFGLGTIGGPAAVVSTERLMPRSKAPTWTELLGMRTIKVVNHELGHVIGLGHKAGDGCLMNDANGTIATVDREHGRLCDHERQAMERLLKVQLPALEQFDWQAVLRG
jgi:archaemetzincin